MRPPAQGARATSRTANSLMVSVVCGRPRPPAEGPQADMYCVLVALRLRAGGRARPQQPTATCGPSESHKCNDEPVIIVCLCPLWEVFVVFLSCCYVAQAAMFGETPLKHGYETPGLAQGMQLPLKRGYETRRGSAQVLPPRMFISRAALLHAAVGPCEPCAAVSLRPIGTPLSGLPAAPEASALRDWEAAAPAFRLAWRVGTPAMETVAEAEAVLQKHVADWRGTLLREYPATVQSLASDFEQAACEAEIAGDAGPVKVQEALGRLRAPPGSRGRELLPGNIVCYLNRFATEDSVQDAR